MNCLAILFGVIFIANKSTQKKTAPTLGVYDRIAILKQQIAHNIKLDQFSNDKISPINNEDFGASYEYVDRDNEPITPINDDNERKIDEKFKLKEIKTTTERVQRDDANLRVKNNEGEHVDGEAKREEKKRKQHKRKKNAGRSTPMDIFYRRRYNTNMAFDSEWTHCQDLITPFFVGHKVNMTEPKIITYDSNNVMRLAQLLNEDVTNHTTDDIFEILFQISNLQIRLFQWDVTSLKFLLNTINKDYARIHKMQTFRSLKEGLLRKFIAWNLDVSNTTNIMRQARIFRPPCVKITDQIGSTKTSRAVRYTTSSKSGSTCPEGDDDCLLY